MPVPQRAVCDALRSVSGLTFRGGGANQARSPRTQSVHPEPLPPWQGDDGGGSGVSRHALLGARSGGQRSAFVHSTEQPPKVKASEVAMPGRATA
eukprot:CAMPEP_0115454598 /NCGR_PEP_ID=MMETSP0271-20121206/43723_1 /TAXON_ID=71861 /ORGANISM="Scrippsiella trochoidea, Strain CCMP3099" /LENGTH=94 /DNA_ID=CAMNT_0002881023 /DNA_START=155 /DNA_END=437 /DNA_ORIENTATION=-